MPFLYRKSPSKRVSNIKESLPTADALQMLYTDPTGKNYIPLLINLSLSIFFHIRPHILSLLIYWSTKLVNFYTGVVTHYTIAKLYEVISSIRERRDSSSVSMLTTFYENGRLLDEWRPLLRILHLGGSGDPFAQRGAALCLSYILLVGCPSQIANKKENFVEFAPVKEALNALISWISSQLQSSSGVNVSLVTPALNALMSCTEARSIFVNSGGIGYISRHLRSKKNASAGNTKKGNGGASAQQLYELCFCLWAMSYDCNTSNAIRLAFARDGAVKSLCDLVSSAPREKVVRVSLSALRNLAECKSDGADKTEKKTIDGSIFLSEMISCGLMKSIGLMKERQWSDSDISDGKILRMCINICKPILAQTTVFLMFKCNET